MTILTRVRYPGNGVTNTFVLPFPYLDRAHVLATTGTGMSRTVEFVTGSTVRITPTPIVGETVLIYRRTPSSSPLVDWQSSAQVLESDLDTAALQALYVVQEIADDLAEANGVWTDANEDRLVDLARTVKFPVGDDVGTLPAALTLAGQLLGVDGTGKVRGVPLSDLSGAPGFPITAAQIVDATLAGRTLLTGSLETQRRVLGVKAHPFDLHRIYLKRQRGAHFWNGPVVWDTIRNQLLVFYSEGWRHGRSIRSSLRVAISTDGGHTTYVDKEVFSARLFESTPAFSAAAEMDSGRIGIYTYIANNSTGETWFHHTDDGVNWTNTKLVGLTHPFVPYGQMLRTPDNGWIVYGYGGSPDTKILYAKTLNNGATWTSGEALAVPGISLAEPSVFQIAAGQYGMIVRDDRSDSVTGYNAITAVSTDMLAWTKSADSGVALGGNPPVGIVEDGVVFLYGCLRRGFAGPPFINELGYIATPASAFWAGGGTVPLADRGWQSGGPMPDRFTGTVWWTKDEHGRTWVSAGVGERLHVPADPAESMSVALFVPNKPVVQTAPAPAPNLLHNPTFRNRSFAAGPTTTAEDALLAERWRWRSNGAGVTAARTFVALTDDERLLIPDRQHTGMKVVSAGAAFAGVYQQFYGPAACRRLLDHSGTVQLVGYGLLPQDVLFQISVESWGAGGSAPPGYLPTFTYLGKTFGDGAFFRLCGKIVFPSSVGGVLGPDCIVRVAILDAGSAGAWDATLCRIKLSISDEWDEIEAPDTVAENAILDTYYETTTYPAEFTVVGAWTGATTSAVAHLKWSPKVRLPTFAGFVSPAGGDFTLGVQSCAAPAVLDQLTASTGRLIVAPASGTWATGLYLPLFVSAGRTATLLIDTGL